MHPIASGDHASDQRLAVLAVPGPVALAKNVIGDLPQTRSGVANISGPKTWQTARELKMASTVALAAQDANRCQAIVEPVIVGKIEMKDAWPASEGATDQVHSNEFASVDQKMLRPRQAEAAHNWRKRMTP